MRKSSNRLYLTLELLISVPTTLYETAFLFPEAAKSSNKHQFPFLENVTFKVRLPWRVWPTKQLNESRIIDIRLICCAISESYVWIVTVVHVK